MYDNYMRVEFDPAKNEANIEKHGISLAAADDFEFDTALVEVDAKKNYGETRYNALGFLDGRLHSLTFTYRDGVVRAISFRRANKRETRNYETSR